MKYIKIIYSTNLGNAERLEYPLSIEGRPVSRREAIQNISELVDFLHDLVVPSPVRKGKDCWYVNLQKHEKEVS